MRRRHRCRGTHLRGDLGAEELESLQPLRLGDLTEIRLEDVPAVPEVPVEVDQPVGNFVGTPAKIIPPGPASASNASRLRPRIEKLPCSDA